MPRRTTSDDDFGDGLAISLVNQQSAHPVDEAQLLEAARCVLREAGLTSAVVSLAVVDDRTMRELNRRYLGHDWPTDVLSFVLQSRAGHVEGEVIVSADTAAANAVECGWPAAAEQLLCVIHGSLHLVGYDDATTAEKRRMREAEARILRRFGIERAAEPAASRAGCSPNASL